MVKGVPVILATDYRLVERHVEVLLRAKAVASVALPCNVASHSLTAGKEHIRLMRQHLGLKKETYP